MPPSAFVEVISTFFLQRGEIFEQEVLEISLRMAVAVMDWHVQDEEDVAARLVVGNS